MPIGGRDMYLHIAIGLRYDQYISPNDNTEIIDLCN